MTRDAPPRGAARWAVFAAATAVWLVAPVPAAAHLVRTGLGPFWDGASHFALTAEDFLPALALALLAGLRGAPAGRRLSWLLPISWLGGGVLGLQLPAPTPPAVVASSLVVLGLLVAADARLALPWLSALGVTAGLLHGFLAGAALATAGLGLLGVTGMVCGVSVAVTLVAARVVSLRAAWTRVAVRVGGSWIAASGLLLLGWALRAAGTR